MRVLHFCSYITKLPDGEKLQGDEWDAMKLVKAMKGDALNGYATISLSTGGSFRLDSSTRDGVFDAFANHASTGLAKVMRPNTTYALVPVPSSKSTVKTADCSGTATHRLTAALVKHLGKRVVAHDMLRFDKPMGSARKGEGTRNPKMLYDAMRAIAKPSSLGHILVDDMLMSGGHLQAAKARIEEAGGHVLAAVCVAKTIHEHTPGSAFVFGETEIPDYDPKAVGAFDFFKSAMRS